MSDQKDIKPNLLSPCIEVTVVRQDATEYSADSHPGKYGARLAISWKTTVQKEFLEISGIEKFVPEVKEFTNAQGTRKRLGWLFGDQRGTPVPAGVSSKSAIHYKDSRYSLPTKIVHVLETPEEIQKKIQAALSPAASVQGTEEELRATVAELTAQVEKLGKLVPSSASAKKDPAP